MARKKHTASSRVFRMSPEVIAAQLDPHMWVALFEDDAFSAYVQLQGRLNPLYRDRLAAYFEEPFGPEACDGCEGVAGRGLDDPRRAS